MIVSVIIILGIIFFFQFSVLKKNLGQMNYEKINIDVLNKKIRIGKTVIPFYGISGVSVNDCDDQPSVAERYFTRYAHCHYYADIEFHLKDGNVVKYQTNSKGQLYKILKKLEPYVSISDDIENYRQEFIDGPTIFGTILLIALFIKFVILRLLQ